MSYNTLSASIMRAVLPDFRRLHLLDDDHDGTEQTGLAQTILDAAQARIDAYFSSRYDVPIGSPSNYVLDLELRMARIVAHERHGIGAGSPEEAAAMRTQLYAELSDIRSGELGLGVDPLPDERPETADIPLCSSADRVFSRSLFADVL